MKKRYILLSRTKSKYEDYYRYHYKLFENYFDLQRHLLSYWYIDKNDYIIFEETNIKKDYSIQIKDRNIND